MKAFPLGFSSLFLTLILLLPCFPAVICRAEFQPAESEIAAARKRAHRSIEYIYAKFSNLEEIDISSAVPRKQTSKYPISARATYLERSRNDLKSAFAELELSRQFPGVKMSGNQAFDLLVTGSGPNFFGTDGHINADSFSKKARVLGHLVKDTELNMADRFFLLLREPGDSLGDVLTKWVAVTDELLSDPYLGSDKPMSPAHQAKCVKSLYFTGWVLQSQLIDEAATEAPKAHAALETFVSSGLINALKTYGRQRFEKDGALRDRFLPVFFASQSILPSAKLTDIGITTQGNLQRLALAHAKGLAQIVQVIDSPAADTILARKAIGQVIDYRIQPFYIGSEEIREKDSIPCPPNGELDIILNKASFFGEEGHQDGNLYRRRIEILEQLFTRPSSEETRDFLFALKKPEEWLTYFNRSIIGIPKDGRQSCLESIQEGEITSMDLKILFLARCILGHPAFESRPGLSDARDHLKATLAKTAPKLAIEHFKNRPSEWNRVDLAFVEISKLVPEFELEELSIPTYDEYLHQRKDYERAISSLPKEFVELASEDTPYLINNEVGLFQSDYIYRTGKYDKRLSPSFVEKINSKLAAIMNYRNSQFTPPDTRKRPGLSDPGSPIRELFVSNRNHPDVPATNPELHDLLEGPKGGFGGMGELFRSDPKGYEMRESALDAIATSDELNLGETLFALALDAGNTSPTDAEKAAAARKWINYFKRTQSIARFHSTAEELAHAIRGAFVTRLVMQSPAFIEAVERTPQVAVGSTEDVSSLLENALSTQVRIMSRTLSSVDPSTALNKDINYIKGRWYTLKAWHTESMKWLETVIADPILMSEVSRIRNLKGEKTDSYDRIVPALSKIEEVMATIEPRILAMRNSSIQGDRFRPLDFANLVMGQLVTLEGPSKRGIIRSEVQTELTTGEDVIKSLSRQITDQLFHDIRETVAQAGFEELSKAQSLTDFPSITRGYYKDPSLNSRGEDILIHELMLHQIKGAVAKAKGRIEAEKVTDLKTLEDLSIRASRADRIFFAGDPDRYSLLVDPSFLLHEWNNRHKIETIAEFRTIETRAQAQTQIFRFRKERERLESERKELASTQEELQDRLEQARKWATENEMIFDPDAVIDEMIAMEDKISGLEGEIKNFQKLEEKYREQHFMMAYELHNLKIGNAKFNRKKQREILLARADLDPLPAIPAEPEPEAVFENPPPKPKPAYNPNPAPTRSYSRPSSSRSSSSRSFFQRLFRGRGRR